MIRARMEFWRIGIALFFLRKRSVGFAICAGECTIFGNLFSKGDPGVKHESHYRLLCS